MAWPPPATSRPLSFAASTAAPRSTPEIERPEPLPMPVLVERDDDRRAAELLLEPAGDDADHARDASPRAATIATARLPCAPRSASAASLTAASIARRSSLSRSSSAAIAARLVRILGGQQAHAEIGLADPAAGVDPRAEREAEIAAVRRAVEPRRVEQRGEADVAARRPSPSGPASRRRG